MRTAARDGGPHAVPGPHPAVLTGWRRRLHVGLHAMILAATAAGLAVSGMTGSRQVQAATNDVLAERAAGSPLLVTWMALVGLLAAFVLGNRTRGCSLAGAGAMVAVGAGGVIAAFVETMDRVGQDLGQALVELFSLRSLFAPGSREVHVALWPADIVAAVLLVCLAAGPAALLAHVALFWREGVVCRGSPRPVA